MCSYIKWLIGNYHSARIIFTQILEPILSEKYYWCFVLEKYLQFTKSEDEFISNLMKIQYLCFWSYAFEIPGLGRAIRIREKSCRSFSFWPCHNWALSSALRQWEGKSEILAWFDVRSAQYQFKLKSPIFSLLELCQFH